MKKDSCPECGFIFACEKCSEVYDKIDREISEKELSSNLTYDSSLTQVNSKNEEY